TRPDASCDAANANRTSSAATSVPHTSATPTHRQPNTFASISAVFQHCVLSAISRCRIKGRPLYEALIVDYAGTFTDPAVAEAVTAARAAGLKTALLSNADHVPAGLPPVFDAVVVSGEVGYGKPDRRIYELAAGRLHAAPRACVYVDDIAAYVRGAVTAGMTGVHHTAAESTVEELAVLLGL
ncbi:HAD-IA family hydrolase, partial [Actinokineospora sp. 24-640]